MLADGASIHVKDRNGWTPLHGAAQRGHGPVIQLLLDRGLDINVTGKNGHTPLLCSVVHEHASIVQLLLDRGADSNAKTADGATPLLFAAKEGLDAIAQAQPSHSILHSQRQQPEAAGTGLPFPRRWGCSHLRLLSLRTCSV